MFAYMLLRNPAYRYMRLAWWITAAWATAAAVPEIKAAFQIQDEASGMFGLGNQVSWAFHFAFAVSVVVCLVLDYLASRESSALRLVISRVHLRLGGQRQEVSGGTAVLVGDVSGQATVNVHQTDVNRELDHVKGLLDRGKPDAAEEHLLRIKRDHDASLTLQQQYRLQAYFGKLFHDRGDRPKAAAHFANASKLRPDDEEGRAHGVLSEFMAGNTENAHQKAVELLAKHPSSSLATAVMLRAAPPETAASDLVARVHASVKDEVDVMAAIAARYLSEGDAETAERYARKVLDKRPDHPAVLGNLGNVLVIGVANGVAKQFWGGTLEEAVRKRLEEAVGLLTRAMRTSAAAAEVRQFQSMRGLAREVLGQSTEAEADYFAAVEGDPTSQETAIRYASFLARKDREPEAIAVLRRAIDTATALEVVVTFSTLALGCGTSADKEKARSSLRREVGSFGAMSPQIRDEVFRLLVFLTYDLTGRTATLAVCQEPWARSVSPVARATAEAAVHLLDGDEAAASTAATVALEALTDSADLPLRLQMAQVMGRLRRYGDVLAILRPTATPDTYEVVGHQILSAASRCGADDFILEYTQSLREAGRWDTFCVELEVEALRRYREFDRAAAVCREFIGQTSDEGDRRFTRLRLSLIGLESGQPDLIEGDPHLLPRLEDVEPRIGRLLCAVLERGSSPIRAVEVAYELVRKHYTSHDAHFALCAAVGIGRGKGVPIPEPETIAAGTAVRIQYDDEATPRWIIVEDGANPDRSRQEYPPDHPLCAELLGKKKGERFVDRANPYQERHGLIEVVGNKFAYRATDSMLRWSDLFPNEFFAITFNLNRPEEGRPDFDPILRSLGAGEQSEESLREWYKTQPVSVLMMSVVSHRHPSQVVLSLASHPDLPVRCCTGAIEEYEVGRANAGSASLVADPTALSTLFVTELWKRITKLPFKLIVTRSSLDEFAWLAEEQRDGSDHRLTREGNEVVRVSLPPENRQHAIRNYEEFVRWLRSVAEVRSGIALASLPQARRDDLIKLFGQPAAESIATALQEQAPVWTDDATVPAVMHEGQPVLRTWTQLVVERLRAAGGITDDQFADLLALLIGYGYQHTQCVPEALFRAAQRSDWNPDFRPLRDVLGWLENRNINEDAVLGVAVVGLRLVWRNALLVQQKESVTLAIGRALARRPSGREMVLGIASVVARFFPMEPHTAEQCRRALLRSLSDPPSGGTGLIVPG